MTRTLLTNTVTADFPSCLAKGTSSSRHGAVLIAYLLLPRSARQQVGFIGYAYIIAEPCFVF